MPKLTLDKTCLYAGKFYGPGEAELPEDAYRDILAKLTPAPMRNPPASGPIDPGILASLRGVEVPAGNLAQSLANPDTITLDPPADEGAHEVAGADERDDPPADARRRRR